MIVPICVTKVKSLYQKYVGIRGHLGPNCIINRKPSKVFGRSQIPGKKSTKYFA